MKPIKAEFKELIRLRAFPFGSKMLVIPVFINAYTLNASTLLGEGAPLGHLVPAKWKAATAVNFYGIFNSNITEGLPVIVDQDYTVTQPNYTVSTSGFRGEKLFFANVRSTSEERSFFFAGYAAIVIYPQF